MRVRARIDRREELVQQLDDAGLTVAARKKTLTLLKRLWLEPRAELGAFSDRGVATWSAGTGVPPAALAWLIEAALRYAGRAVPASTVGSMGVLHPFALERPLAMVMAQAEGLELRYHRPGEPVVDIRTWQDA